MDNLEDYVELLYEGKDKVGEASANVRKIQGDWKGLFAHQCESLEWLPYSHCALRGIQSLSQDGGEMDNEQMDNAPESNPLHVCCLSVFFTMLVRLT